MKFVSRKPTEREAREGARRRVVKFAWRPINCDDGHTYWLRRIVIEQEGYMKPVGPYYLHRQEPEWRVLSKLPLTKLPKLWVRRPEEQR